MTDLAQTSTPASIRFDDPAKSGLDVRLLDVLVALVTFAASLAVLAYGMNPAASLRDFLLLHLAVLCLPTALVVVRARRGDDLTIAALLLIATGAMGPIGALGCAIMTLSLWSRRPSPVRLQEWYDYISGVVGRARVAHIYAELISDRLPTDPDAKVPRFTPILQGASLEDQQRVLGVIGRRYHADFRPVLRKALRNRNGFIRAQAAAVASKLNAEEKNRLWSTARRPGEPAHLDEALDGETRRS
jgi:hypothetical protein